MPTPTKFNNFTKHLVDGVHNFASHTFKVVLSPAASAPVATNTILSDLTQIANGNGYTTGGATLSVSTSTSGGVAKITIVDPVFTASGGSMAAFQYASIYNDTPTSPADPLICWINYGSAVTLLVGETYTLDFDGTNGVLTF